MRRNVQSWDDEVLTKVEEHNGRRYYLESAMEYIIDDYDEYLGSVELSHYERLSYYKLKDYTESKNKSSILDLRWMNMDDVVQLGKNESNVEIDTVLININNLDRSYFPTYNGFSNLNVVISEKQTNLSPILKIRILKRFLESNARSISSVEFVGFNSVMTAILSKYAERYITSKEDALRQEKVLK